MTYSSLPTFRIAYSTHYLEDFPFATQGHLQGPACLSPSSISPLLFP